MKAGLTLLVVLHHTAITCGATGGWFYHEVPPSASLQSIVLTFFCAINQAYFMGFFFLLSGYFTPAALERKGAIGFLWFSIAVVEYRTYRTGEVNYFRSSSSENDPVPPRD